MNNSLGSRILSRLKEYAYKFKYSQAVKKILSTAPVNAGAMKFILLSMVHQRDVLSYLVAVKSFVRFANPGRIVVVCDPSMTAVDREILKKHVPQIELRSAEEFTHPRIPRGGCWERLYAISEYVVDNYVVQLDADTISIHLLDEVVDAIKQNDGFVLGEIPNQKLMTLAQTSTSAWAHPSQSNHIQAAVERSIKEVGLPSNNLYVRGCAGFTGFPVNQDMRQLLIEFSTCMQSKFGSRWAEWGTEQITSNYLVANARNTRVLPFPKYATPNKTNNLSVFVHYIGLLRFKSSRYARDTKKTIMEIP
ncbi:MAG: hypothetical protein V4713_09220 [Pseudomonadota bacterium]